MSIRRLILALTSLACGFAAMPAALAQGSVQFVVNGAPPDDQDHAVQTDIPPGFGQGEFTFELWIRPDNSFPVGPTDGGQDQLRNWTEDDNTPYSSGNWWFDGNFLLDGHNNGSGFAQGTFTLQFYGAGRVRWLFGDDARPMPDGDLWSVGAFPASNAPSLLDGQWHQITLVRRCPGSGATLELWIDGTLIDTETSNGCVNMRQWWDGWSGFPGNQQGWFWGAEKEAAIGSQQYEDYKGLVDEVRFWSRAKSAAEIGANYDDPVSGSETGLVGVYRFDEGSGNSVCDALDAGRCMTLVESPANVWSTDNAPLSGSGDTTAPTQPTNLSGTAVSSTRIDLSWSPSTDNVAVTGYQIRRDGVLIDTVAGTSYSDTGRTPSTSYDYTVSARDAAGNVSIASAVETVTTPAAGDTEAPSTPTGLQGSAASTTQIDLSWNASTDNVGVTGYEIRRDGALISTVAGTSYSDTGLTANTSYSYTVAARDAAGNVSAESAAAAVSTLAAPDTEAPTTPTGLSGTGVTTTRIDLSWNASTDNVGVTGYEIRRDGGLIATVTGTTYSDTGLTANTSYSYTVAARDAAGNVSAESGAAVASTLAVPDTEAPTVPDGLTGNAISSSQIDLNWNASTDNIGVSDYQVRRDGALIGTVPGTSLSDRGLSADTDYSYTVAARDHSGNVSAESGAVVVSTPSSADTQAPTTPTGLAGTAVSTTRIDLNWNASTDNVAVTGYEVREGGVLLATVTATSYSSTGLTANTSYSYTITARDAAGNVSAASSPLAVSTPANPSPPPPPTTDSGGGGSFGTIALLLLFATAVSRRRRRPAPDRTPASLGGGIAAAQR